MVAGIILIVLLMGTVVFMAQQPVVGGKPSGKRLERIVQSPHYRQGSFQNSSPTAVQSKEFSVWKLLHRQLNPPAGKEPGTALPVVKTDLSLSNDHPTVTWFGHSSYYIVIGGRRILVDPVLSAHAAPVSFFGKSYPGTNTYTPDDFPTLDVVLITHDHYDHLDHKTIVRLKSKVNHFYTSLGVGAHLERWGIEPEKITELDWWESMMLVEGIELIAVPARHFSGRSVKRNNTLWSSFIMKSEKYRLYLGGDSGYDTHFKTIGEKYGPFDLAILECGQYNTMWPLIHMMPEEAVQAALDLRADAVLPVHWGRFSLALHPWKEPIERILAAAKNQPIKITTPMIGEPVIIGESYPSSRWWDDVK
jgi:L-ascorbate metabolism protein UlaG (beta-lactamase superfamily)